MADTNPQNPNPTTKDESRVLPLLISGLFCFLIASLLGFGAWSVFGSQARERGDTARFLQRFGINSVLSNTSSELKPVETISGPSKTENANVNNAKSETETTTEIEGVVKVEGGEFAIGGGDSKDPIQRLIVEDFMIAETEVTNAQYAEFIEETDHRSPIGWTKTTFPKGTENYPVVNISWNDAQAFCNWLGEKLNVEVRLPTETEWEYAARGKKRFKYPWGNDWDDKAAASKQTKGKIRDVKTYPINKSPFGAYDMAGNVWEWTAEEATLKDVKEQRKVDAIKQGRTLRVVKGGSANESPKYINGSSKFEIPQITREKTVGFRYVIIATNPKK